MANPMRPRLAKYTAATNSAVFPTIARRMTPRNNGDKLIAAAAASILRSWTGTDSLGYSVTFSGGSSTAEPRVTPARELSLKWETFTEVADAAGRSSRYAGTSFPQSDLAGRELGQKVAEKVLAKANRYFDGVASFQATPTDASPLFKK